MNRFYFKNKNNPQKRCYEVYGVDAFTGIRYSIALCGSRNAAQRVLDRYLVRIQPSDYYVEDPQYEGLLFIEQTTIERYFANRHKELTQRLRLRMSYQFDQIYIGRHTDEIMAKIISRADSIGGSDFQIGNESKLDTLERLISHCTNYRVVKRYADDTHSTVELAIELFFVKSRETKYSYDSDIPDADTFIQNQSAVIYRGTDEGLRKFVESPLFEDTCIGFFREAIKNHYYGFSRVNYLYVTPVYNDYRRTEDEFKHCFLGFLIEQGYNKYTPKHKKVWFD